MKINDNDDLEYVYADSALIRQDPFIRGLLKHMPDNVSRELSNDQLLAIKKAIIARQRNAWINKRGTLRLPFRHFSYRILIDSSKPVRKHRKGTRRRFLGNLLVLGLIAFAIVTALYLLKSAAGIDIFSFSLDVM